MYSVSPLSSLDIRSSGFSLVKNQPIAAVAFGNSKTCLLEGILTFPPTFPFQGPKMYKNTVQGSEFHLLVTLTGTGIFTQKSYGQKEQLIVLCFN